MTRTRINGEAEISRIPRYCVPLILASLLCFSGCQKNTAHSSEPTATNNIAEIQQSLQVEADNAGAPKNTVDSPQPENAPAKMDTTDSSESNDGTENPNAVSDNADAQPQKKDCPDIQSQDPLCSDQLQVLSAIQEDPEPEVLYAVHTETIGRHYLVSDEKHPDLFKESIENKGGTYIGVGFDQGYLYIGWQRPSLAFFIDYDPWIVLNHRVLAEVMKICDQSQCLYDHFAKKDVADAFLDSQQAIDAGFSDKETKYRIKRLRYAVVQALSKLRSSELKTMMNDAEIYNTVRNLLLSGRLRILQANLLETGGIQSIANAMKQLKAEVQTLYLSNAEQYWNYSDQFKANMLALPFTKDGIIMRTRATYPRNSDYRYSIQPAAIFQAWMAHPKTREVKSMIKHVSIRKPDQFPFVIDDIMPDDT